MTTRPAPAETTQPPPASARLTSLAIAALENGVSPDDVRAYLEGARAHAQAAVRFGAP